ncbi:MAG TPA: hypothetical protein VID69_09455 [Actinomycetota bacterium]
MTGSRAKVLAVCALILTLGLAACDGSSDTDQEIADLEQQVADLEAELETTQSALEDSEEARAEAEEQAAEAEASLADTQDQLASTQEELATTQAQLQDAQAQLAQVGELVLENGTYVGPVLGAKTSPARVIVFNAGGLFRVAQVADDVTITAGGSDLSLSQFAKLLASTDSDDANLANGNYKVIVKQGLVTSIRKSKA